MADIYSRLMDGVALAQQGADVKKRSTLASLYSQAIGAAPEQRQGYIGQIAALDPKAANDASTGLYKMDDSAKQALGQEAAIFAALPADQKPQAYAKLAQHAQSIGIPVPMEYNPGMDENIGKIAQALGGTGPGGNVQSTYIDAMGNRVAIMRDGTTAILGRNAPNNQIIDTGNGFYGVNKGNLQAAPVMIGGQPQQAPQAPSGLVQTPSGPINIDPNIAPEIRAQIAANPDAFTQGGTTQGAPVVESAPDPMQGGQLRSTMKPAEQQRLGMEQQRLELAQQAATRASEAAQAAQELKTQVAQEKTAKSNAAAQDTIDNLNDGVQQIDSLLKSPGMQYLGTGEGDLMLKVPVIRNSAKDANAQLDVIRNRVVLSTLASLKSLSANGASGFGALSNQEGEILRNSIASLSNAQSNAQIISGLKQVQNAMRRSAQRIHALQGGQAPASRADPQSGGVDDLLSKYGVK